MGKYYPLEGLSPKSNLLEGEVLSAPPALVTVAVHTEGSSRSPPPRHLPAKSCLAARPLPQSERYGWGRARTCL